MLMTACSPPPTGKITIDSRPKGAKVMLNGVVCPLSPCDFELPPGDYQVTATLQDYKHAEETVTVTRNANAYRTLHLLPMVPTEEEARRMNLRKKPEKPGGAYEP